MTSSNWIDEERLATLARMPRDEAEKHFRGRILALQDRIKELPTPEKLRLAADMLEERGISRQMPLAVVRLVLSEVEALAHGRESNET